MFRYLAALICFTCILQNAFADRGDVVWYELIETISAEDLGVQVESETGLPAFFLGIEYDIEVYKIAYETLDYDGITPTIATGAIALPTNFPCPAALLTYGHGLSLKHREVPSSNTSIYQFIAKGMAANGFAAVAPDYIHMGFDSDPGFQAFMHAQSESDATIDMIRATKQICAELDFELTEQLFISGYSQGGHSSMATCKAIQEDYSDEFNVTAACPGGGTFDLSGIAADSLASETRTTGEPHALCLIVRSYLAVYADSLIGWDYNYTMDDLFKHPYDSLLSHILDPNDPFSNTGLLDNIPNRMLEDEFREDFLNDPNHVMRRMLGFNNLYDWAPQMPMLIFHSTADVENPFPNVEFTLDRFDELGVTSVELATLDNLSHSDAGLYHVLQLRTYFLGLRDACESIGINSPESQLIEAKVFPNPFSDSFTIELKEESQLSSIALFNSLGEKVQEFHPSIVNQNSTIQINENLAKGFYLLSGKSEKGKLSIPVYKQ